jgi:hypothetical protein
VKLVHTLLQRALEGTADVRPWPKEFQLTRAYIESLESLLDVSDFSVLVLTPDDRTTSRNTERLSPRDNVVFEMGLFFGRLGRERCFVLKPDNLDLKLPSDLLGIEAAQFPKSAKASEDALAPACFRIGEAIRAATARLPSRPKLDDASRAAQAAIRRFADRVAGTWWERIQLKGETPTLSFLEIGLDEIHSSVWLAGEAYNKDGVLTANWRSASARVEGATVLYVRECMRTDAKNPAWLPGLGEANFERDGDVLDRGHGRFWESDESRPEETVIKRVELRRTIDKSHALTMRKGNRQEREALVSTILDAW